VIEKRLINFNRMRFLNKNPAPIVLLARVYQYNEVKNG
jgi:hypothetical protein